MSPEIQDAVERQLAALFDLRQITVRRFTLDGFTLGETIASICYGIRIWSRRGFCLVVQHIYDIRGNVGKEARLRLEQIRMYLQNRLHMMPYDELRQEDLEVASGVVEGGVKHVIGKRFDNGSMRWIKERAEALLQLRCIEINGDWENFVQFVERELSKEGNAVERPTRLLTTTPAPIPIFDVAA